jgi:hypothetical protein
MFNNPIYQATLKRYEDLKKEYVVARTSSDLMRMREIEMRGKKTKKMLDWMEKVLENKTETPIDQTVQDVIEIFT